jgi:hypothetical protein
MKRLKNGTPGITKVYQRIGLVMRTGTDTGYFQPRSPPDAWGEMEKEMEQRESDRSPTVIDTIKKTIDDLIQEIERKAILWRFS